MKRESGENPEQTRCCKLDPLFRASLLPLSEGREGARKASKSEDLPICNPLSNGFRGIKPTTQKGIQE